MGPSEQEKKVKVATLVAVLKIPVSSFNHPVFKDIFSMANLGPVNEKIARKFADAEAL